MGSAMMTTMPTVCFFPLVSISLGRKARTITSYCTIAVLTLTWGLCTYFTLYFSLRHERTQTDDYNHRYHKYRNCTNNLLHNLTP